MIALCATGCFSDHGVAIEIDVGDTGATLVELYIGKAPCVPDKNAAGIDCTSIAPPNGAISLAGEVWFRDDLSPYTADVKGHKATLQLKSDTATMLPIVIAVGFAPGDQGARPVGTATLLALEIPANSARVVTATLVGANAVVPGQINTEDLTEDRVMVWNKRTPQSSCVVVEHWTRGEPVKREFVVPAEDPDCDDVSHECNAAAYHGSSAAGDPSSTPDCLVSETSRCVLGSRGCTDDFGPLRGECAALPDQVCVPGAFCACSSLDPLCIRTKLDENPALITHIECSVPLLPDVDGCSNQEAIDFGAHYQGGSCGQEPVLAHLQLANLTANHDFGGVQMDLSSANAPCSFKVLWKGGTRTALDLTDHGVIKLETSRGAVIIPIIFHFVPGPCNTAPFKCTITDVPNDPLWTCAP